MDQIQQNFIKTNKSQKKIGGYFWCGFSDLGRNQQNQARKRGVGAPKTWSTWLMIPYDVGWNPIASIFHVWSGSYGETRRTRGSTKGKHGENERESLNRTRIDYTSARSSHTRGDTRSKVNKGRYKGNRFFSVRRSWSSSPEGGLESKGIFSEEAAVSHKE